MGNGTLKGTIVKGSAGGSGGGTAATDRDGAVIGFSSNSKKKILIPRGNYFVRILTTGGNLCRFKSLYSIRGADA